jgi:hypothetical protein
MKHPRLLSIRLLLLQLSLLPVVSVLAAADDNIVPPPAHRPGCQSRCGDVDIPYPFGIVGDDHRCAIHTGFDVNCTRLADGTYRPFNGPFEVTNISVPDAKAWMKMNISWRCYEVNQTKASPWWYQFTDTPFRFSYEDNRIYVIGCNTLAYMRSEPVSRSFTRFFIFIYLFIHPPSYKNWCLRIKKLFLKNLIFYFFD